LNILIIGGSSLIAQNIAYIYSKDLSNKIILTSRKLDKAQIIAEDLKIRTNNQNIFSLEFNPTDFNSHLEFKEKVLNLFDID
jgi:glutamyl-tRNA reductase